MYDEETAIEAQQSPIDSREILLIGIMILSLILSAGGILWGALSGEAHIGQRGGALGVALSFFMLFAGRDTSKRLLNLESSDLDTLPDQKPAVSPKATDSRDEKLVQQVNNLEAELAQAQHEIDNAHASISTMLDWSAKEKVFLSISSITSTLVCGFGDYATKAFGAI